MAKYIREDLEATLKEAAENRDEYNDMLGVNPLPWSELVKIEFSSHLQEMKDNVVQVNEYLEQWEGYIKKIKNDDTLVQEEAKLPHEWKNKADHRALLKDINKIIRKCEDYLKLELATNGSFYSSISLNDQVIAYAAGPRASIPHVNIPKFNGDYMKWNAFWQMFNILIHMQPYPEVEKMIALLALLEGRALEEVEGYEICEANYPQVIDILQHRFGNNHLVIMGLQAKLRSLERAKPNAESIKTVVNTVYTVCQQLKTYGIDINNASLKLDIIDKLPESEKHELQKMLILDPGATTTEVVLQKMKEFALVAEVTSSNFSSASYGSSKTGESSFKKRLCIYCNDDHASGSCPRYASPESKLQQLKAKHRCTNCTGNHEAKHCYAKVVCHNCNGNHQTFLSKARTSSKQGHGNATSSFLSVGKAQGLLLTKEVVVANLENGAHVQAIVMFDCGSQRSYISNELINKLKLPKVNFEKLNVRGFGGKLSTYSSALIGLQLMTEGKPMNICANSAPQLASTVPLVQSYDEQSKRFTVRNVKRDILVGMDYFFNLITSFEERSEDLFKVHSKVGKIFTGKQVQQKMAETLSSIAVDMSSIVKHKEKRKPFTSNVFSPNKEIFTSLRS